VEKEKPEGKGGLFGFGRKKEENAAEAEPPEPEETAVTAAYQEDNAEETLAPANEYAAAEDSEELAAYDAAKETDEANDGAGVGEAGDDIRDEAGPSDDPNDPSRTN
jgi:hypothetical protein